MTIAPLRRGGLHHQVVELLGSRITAGELAEGEVLPNQTEIAEQLGVSRTVVREALKVLGEKGLVASKQKIGTRVLVRSEWNFVDSDVLRWIFGGERDLGLYQQVSEIRSIIEPSAARLAAQRCTAETAEQLFSAYDDLAKSTGDEATYIEADLRLHTLILRTTGNVLLYQMTSAIAVALEASRRVTVHAPGGASSTLQLHRSVVEAIAAGDGSTAEAEMSMLVNEALSGIETVLSASGRSSDNEPGRA